MLNTSKCNYKQVDTANAGGGLLKHTIAKPPFISLDGLVVSREMGPEMDKGGNS